MAITLGISAASERLHQPARHRAMRRSTMTLAAAPVLLATLALALPPGSRATAPAPPAAPTAAPPRAPAAEPWADGFLAAPPAELLRAATAADAAPADDQAVGVLFLETILSYDEAGRVTRTERMVYRLRSAAADASWSAVEQSWLPWHEAAPRVRARVVTADGAEHRLDPTLLSQSRGDGADPEMFDDRAILRGPLPATGPGAVVEEEDVIADTEPLFDRGTVRFLQLARASAVRHARAIVEAPAAMPLRYAARLLPGVTPRREILGNRVRITFDVRDLPAAVEESWLPPDAPRAAGIDVATGASWNAIARAYGAIVDRSLAGADLAGWLQAAGADRPAGSQIERIERVLAHQAEIRYTGMELGAGRILPRTPAQTLSRRFGDCKDKAVLLVAALRAMEVPAYVALLAAGPEAVDADPGLPGFGAFNHAIVYLPGAPAVWIDPTNPYARAGELPAEDQGRLALIAAPEVQALVRTPASAMADNRLVTTREIRLADDGPASAVETIEFSGAIERSRRAFVATTGDADLGESAQKYAQRVFLAQGPSTFRYSDPGDLAQPLRRRLEVPKAKRGLTDETSAVAALTFASLFDYVPDELFEAPPEADRQPPAGRHGKATAPRQADYYLGFPHITELRYRVVPPAGFELEKLPPSRNRQLGTARLQEEYASGDQGVVNAVLRFESGKQRLSPAELAALRTALATLNGENIPVLRFRQIGEAQAAAGHVREALLEFRREAAAAPARAMPHLRMARALLGAGLGEAARQEVDRALQLEPRSSAAHLTLGRVLEHDAVGRQFGRGFSHRQALAAYGKATQLDPAAKPARIKHIDLLERDDRGVLYAPGADLGAAIAEIQRYAKDFDDHALDESLLIDELYAGRFDDVIALAPRLPSSATVHGVLIAATAMKQGAAAAIAEAERRLPEPKERLTVLSSCAATLVRLRGYTAAAALLETAGPMSPNASELLTRAAVLRQVRPLRDVPAATDSPAGTARRMLVLMGLGTPKPADFMDLLSRRMLPSGATSKQDQGSLLAGIESKLGEVAARGNAAGLPLDALMEIGLAAAEERVTGDDATGHQVVISSRLPGAPTVEIYVVREDGRYRIVAFGNEDSMLGNEALRRLTEGDPRAARQWLDWAREAAAEPHGDPPRPAFSALWTRGQTADEQQVRCAAAALAATGDAGDAERSLPALRTCRAAARDESRQIILDEALAGALRKAGRWPELLTVAARMAAARPLAEQPFDLAVLALHETKAGPAAIEQMARARLERLPGDRDARMILVQLDRQRGDLESAERRLRELAAEAGARSDEINSLAWLMLVRGHADEHAVELAQRAAQLSDTHDELHTLAALLVERGKPGEAYQVILQALKTEDDDGPRSSDWYVFGRLAESYGLPEAAAALYRRVVSPREDVADSTYRLAQKRLAALAAGGVTGNPAAAPAATAARSTSP
jgi:tetratricopeptide (TPR) repeat protein